MQNVINKVQHEIKRGDIWLANMPGGIGSEQNMNRPVVIFQNSMANKFSPCCTIIPLTSSRGKKWIPTHVTLHKTLCLTSLSIALAEQVTTVSKERLSRYIGTIHPSELLECENALMIQLGIGSKNNIAYAN